MAALERAAESAPGGAKCPVSFITTPNTLGSCLVFAQPGGDPVPGLLRDRRVALPGAGLGGLAGRRCTRSRWATCARSGACWTSAPTGWAAATCASSGWVACWTPGGYRRIRAAGAHVVGVGTGYRLKGAGVLGEIEAEVILYVIQQDMACEYTGSEACRGGNDWLPVPLLCNMVHLFRRPSAFIPTISSLAEVAGGELTGEAIHRRS
ncbi:hypothetical protein VTK56DRAFT_9260 [Thermocarpiscus australiensis]